MTRHKKIRENKLEIEEFFTIQAAVFSLASVFFVVVSWKSLQNIYSHGFYRFFAFEGILVLLLMNASFWTINPFSVLQLMSWILLFASILFVGLGLYLLKEKGGPIKVREAQLENLSFENTTILVTEGIFKYIRHPMYSSLVLLVWGALFKHVTVFGFFIAVISTFFLVIAAKLEEKENVLFFGVNYENYIKKTKMFFPCLL